MAKVTVCSAGAGSTDQVFSVEMEEPEDIEMLVRLVKNGGKATGLLQPAITVESNGHFQDISNKNGWVFDRTKL